MPDTIVPVRRSVWWWLRLGLLLPIITGFIPRLFPHAGEGYSLLAYRWIFATLAIALALGLAIYLTAKDSKPLADSASEQSGSGRARLDPPPGAGPP